MKVPQKKCAYCGRPTTVHPAQIRSGRLPSLPKWSAPSAPALARLPHHPLRVKGVPAPLCQASRQGQRAQLKVLREEAA